MQFIGWSTTGAERKAALSSGWQAHVSVNSVGEEPSKSHFS
jgi:ribosome-associated protein YbcJ (S4-like RNA binding protein)